MKKFYFYGMVIVCLFCTVNIHAQNRFWIRAAASAGDWNDANNWSLTSGGGGGAGAPGVGQNAIFNNGATVNVNVASINIARITVTGGVATRLLANTASVITVTSTVATDGSEGLYVGPGATLEQGVSANVAFSITFADDALGQVDGTWHLTGIPAVVLPNGATFNLPAVTTESNRLDINGTLRISEFARRPPHTGAVGSAYLFFNNGSTYWHDRNGNGTPPATWAASSTILLSGMVDLGVTLNIGSTSNFGNLTINSPAMNNPSLEPVRMNLSNNMVFLGNVTVQNTNNWPLVLLFPVGGGNVTVNVNGSFNVSGTSVVYVAEDNTRSFRVNVGGALSVSAGSLFLQRETALGTNTTTLAVAGAVNLTGGIFGPGSTFQSATDETFALELNGTGPQTVTTTGTIQDANNMLSLRLNNAAGASLASPASFGKISWNSANKGILTTTTTNLLSITNPDPNSVTVINAPANNGYVNGPIRRSTNANDLYLFPTGKSGFLRYCELVPGATTASVYTAEYFRSAYPQLNVSSPLTGVSNVEYWEITRQSGSSAAIRLNVSGAVPGAGPGDALVVARYGTSWVSAKGASGTTLTPGNTPSGTVLSEQQASFSPFTLAFGPAGALPIDLVSFTGRQLSSGAALLNWEVTNNSTPDRFEVLRSTDGNSFSHIGTVQGVNLQTHYNYTDNGMPAGTIYYRLRMVDVNGQVKHSNVVAINNGTNELLLTSMAPTVVTNGRARISVTSSQRGNLSLVITDMYGRIVKQQINGVDKGSQEIWLNLQSLASGAYQITGYLDGKRSASFRFIKQ